MPRRLASHTAWSRPRSPASRKPSSGLRRIDDVSFESLKPQIRATGSDKYWDTVTATYGVNSFARPAAVSANKLPMWNDSMVSPTDWSCGLAAWLAEREAEAKAHAGWFHG